MPPRVDFQGRKVDEVQPSIGTAEVAPTIIALQEHLEIIWRSRQTEVERIRRRQVSFCPEQQDAIEELIRGIVTTIRHRMVKVLEAASSGREAALLRTVHSIFNLEKDQQDDRRKTNQGIDAIRS
jgi:glutamyl-tRNA reductase